VLGWRLGAKASTFVAFCLLNATCDAADLLSPTPVVNQSIATLPQSPSPELAPLGRLNSIFVFAGTLTDGNMGESVNAFKVPSERNHIFGAAYDRDMLNLGKGVVISGQVGVADRFGDGNSGEFWGGARIRTSFTIFNGLSITPALTAGLNAVTSCIGIECQREIEHNGNAHLLFYFSPEVAFTLQRYPNFDLVYQLHHRSGLFQTLGKMEEGTNANVLGIRYHF
jgi:hypothetical protein